MNIHEAASDLLCWPSLNWKLFMRLVQSLRLHKGLDGVAIMGKIVIFVHF